MKFDDVAKDAGIKASMVTGTGTFAVDFFDLLAEYVGVFGLLLTVIFGVIGAIYSHREDRRDSKASRNADIEHDEYMRVMKLWEDQINDNKNPPPSPPKN